MKYYIFTLGCQMNENDSQKIMAVLEKISLKETSEQEADLIVINACSVRQKPLDRIWGKLKVWRKNNPKVKIFLTGCVLPADRKKLINRVDKIFKIESLNQLPSFLGKQNLRKDYFQISPKRKNPEEALVPIMTGCNNFCSYCAVPFTRGREISRPPKDIICEIEKLIHRGYNKITLLGQNVNSYKYRQTDFVNLINETIALPGKFKIFFLSPHPKDFPPGLISLIAKSPKLSNEIHLPFQSGDDQILKKMNRPYTSKQYLNLIKTFRAEIPDLKLSTDIIVGFPTETKKAFQNTINTCKKANFAKAYISIYSPRPGTVSARLKDDIPADEKRKRWKILNDLINKD